MPKINVNVKKSKKPIKAKIKAKLKKKTEPTLKLRSPAERERIRREIKNGTRKKTKLV